MRAWAWIAGLLACVSAMPAQAQRDFAVADRPVLDDRYPERKTGFPGGVTGLADVVYSTLPGYRPLRLDLYLPERPAGAAARPLIVYVHGGGWMGGHTRHGGAAADFPKLLASLAAEGFVVASIEYRLAGEARFPAQLQDVRAAIRFLKDNGARYGIDAQRVGLWGGSAGGHLAALAALSCGAPGIDVAPAPAGSECVQAAAIWYGVFDFASLATGPGIRTLLGCESDAPCPAEKVAAASPLTFLDPSDPPFLLIHGRDDRTVPVTQSELASAKMRTAGVPVREILIPGVDHSFIGATPAVTRAATLQALNATFDFFHEQLDAARP